MTNDHSNQTGNDIESFFDKFRGYSREDRIFILSKLLKYLLIVFLVWFTAFTFVRFFRATADTPFPDSALETTYFHWDAQTVATHMQAALIRSSALSFYLDSISSESTFPNPDCSMDAPSGCWPQNIDELMDANYLDRRADFNQNIWGLPINAHIDGGNFAINIHTPSIQSNLALAETFGNAVLIDNTNETSPTITVIVEPPGS